MTTATRRQLSYLSDLVDKLAAATDRSADDIYDDLGAYEHNAWGRTLRPITKTLASHMITSAKRRLDDLA